jgi:hypothetical protein
MREPIIHLYALCWNEERMLPYFFRHYDPIVSRYFIADNGSTDASVALLEQHPAVSLEKFDVTAEGFVLSALHFYDHAWKQSREKADFVVVCNVDEHFDHDDPRSCWKRWKAENITVVQCAGFEMVSDSFPMSEQRLVDQIKTGIRCEIWDKPFIFDRTPLKRLGIKPGDIPADHAER